MTRRPKRKRWQPPTGAGLARWRKLVAEATLLAEHPDFLGYGLRAAADAVARDPFPSSDPQDWAVLHNWRAACLTFVAMDDAGRAAEAERLAQRTNEAEAIIDGRHRVARLPFSDA